MSELLKKQVNHWKKCFEETGFLLKKAQEDIKQLTVCQCSEFDAEFNIHCNSCVKDKIESLEKRLETADVILKTYEIAGSKMLAKEVWEMGLENYLVEHFNKPNKTEASE